MNTLKSLGIRTTKSLLLCSISVLGMIASTSSLAQQAATIQSQTALSATMQDSLAPVVYRNEMIENLVVEQASSMVESASGERKLRVFRTRNMNMTVMRGENASFAIKGATSKVNGALTLAGTALQTEVNESLTAWAQVLSLVATRKVSAEFAYATKIDKDSRLDSVIAYKLRPNSDSGKPVMVASIKYGIKF